MPSFWRLFLMVGTLGLIGLGIAAAISAAIVIVVVAAVMILCCYIYKRTSYHVRYSRQNDANTNLRNF